MKFLVLSIALPAIMAVGSLLSGPAVAHPDPAAKRVAILIFDQVQLIDYSGPLEVMSDAPPGRDPRYGQSR